MRDKKEIINEIRDIIFQIKLAKFDENKKLELDLKHRELKKELAQLMIEENNKQK